MHFEWDPEKARANETRHGVPFDEAIGAFRDPLSITILDPDHSEEEDRFILTGRSSTGWLLVVIHTDRGSAIRIISARRATRREQRTYEQET